MFTTANRDQIMFRLGYPITAGSVDLIQAAMDRVTAISSDAVTRIQSYLTTLSTIDTELATARTNTAGAYAQLKGEGRRVVGILALSLDLKIENDIY